jgi:hypothetical protein
MHGCSERSHPRRERSCEKDPDRLGAALLLLGTAVHVQSPIHRPFWRPVVMGTKAMIPRASRQRPGSCSKLCSSYPLSSGRHYWNRSRGRARVGESVVVMFEEQFASRDTIRRCRAQLVPSQRRGMAGSRSKPRSVFNRAVHVTIQAERRR